MNTTTAEAGAITIEDLRKTAIAELGAMRNEGCKADSIASVENPIREVIDLMNRFCVTRQRLLATPDTAGDATRAQLAQLVMQIQNGIQAVVGGMRFEQQAVEIEKTLYLAPSESKGGDAMLLDFLQQMEIRAVLRQRPPADVAKAYQQAVAAGNQLVVRAIESDPLRDLVTRQTVEDGQRRRAEISNPVQANQLREIRRKQSALNGVVAAAGLMLTSEG